MTHIQFPTTIHSLTLISVLCLIFISACLDSPGRGTVTVVFNSCGGGDLQPRMLRENELIPVPQEPSKLEHSFTGWYNDTAKSVLWNFKTGRVKKDIILYAGWSLMKKPEMFDQADRPHFIYNNDGDYNLCEPWNYNKKENNKRKYPLFIYLHGAGSPGTPEILPCFNTDTDKKKYPCFVYLPHTSGSWDNERLISQIEDIKSSYRVDQNRIYLMGHSMGGSGSYSLANEYYDKKKQLFAGIVRMAGQSQAELQKEIADKTSVWYFVGLADTKLRVEVARVSYKFLKGYPGNSDAVEISDSVNFSRYRRTTSTLVKKGIEIVKYTEYKFPVGHGISHIPLKDPYLLDWLFSQSLEKR